MRDLDDNATSIASNQNVCLSFKPFCLILNILIVVATRKLIIKVNALTHNGYAKKSFIFNKLHIKKFVSSTSRALMKIKTACSFIPENSAAYQSL